MLPWNFNQSLMSGFWDSVTAPFQDWLNQYPVLLWLAGHPLWLLGTIVLTLFLLAGLLRAVASLTEKLWLTLLRFPILLFQWLWQGTFFLLSRPFAPKSPIAQAALPSSSDRLAELLDRLEALRKEQDELLQEVKSIVSTQRRTK